MPAREDLKLEGLTLSAEDFAELMSVEPAALLEEAATHDAVLDPLQDRLPPELARERNALRQRLASADEGPPSKSGTGFARPRRRSAA
jgi:phosphoenolpyruvate carboxykinase (GTP)